MNEDEELLHEGDIFKILKGTSSAVGAQLQSFYGIIVHITHSLKQIGHNVNNLQKYFTVVKGAKEIFLVSETLKISKEFLLQ